MNIDEVNDIDYCLVIHVYNSLYNTDCFRAASQ